MKKDGILRIQAKDLKKKKVISKKIVKHLETYLNKNETL